MAGWKVCQKLQVGTAKHLKQHAAWTLRSGFKPSFKVGPPDRAGFELILPRGAYARRARIIHNQSGLSTARKRYRRLSH
jgi:hypothetical protein